MREMQVGLTARIDGTLPHLATKAELTELRAELRADLADKPGKTYLRAVIGVLVAVIVASYGAGLAAIALLH